MHLGDFLRQTLGLTGTHLGCEHGVCGACTVIVDGRAVRSCLMLAVQADGADVETVESLGSADALSPLQQAFSRASRAAMRLLHARHADVARSVLARQSASRRRRNPRRDFGKHLPLHRLSGHCRCGAAAAAAAQGPRMSARYFGAPFRASKIRGCSPVADAMSTTSRCPACCRPPSCARKSPMDASAASMPQRREPCPALPRSTRWRTSPISPQGPMPPMAPHPLIKTPITYHPLASDEVRYVGEAIAIVLAETRAASGGRGQAINLDIEHLRCGRRSGAGAGGGRAARAFRARQQSDRDVARRHWQRERRVRQRRASLHREHLRCIVAAAIRWNAAASWPTPTRLSGDLTIWTSSQSPYMVRRYLAAYLQRDEFDTARRGARMSAAASVRRPMSIRKNSPSRSPRSTSGRPVKWIEDRSEHFVATTQQRDQFWTLEVAFTARAACSACAGVASTTTAPMRPTA